MKMINCYLFAFFAINTVIAQQSSNLNLYFLSKKTVIANLNYSILPTTINTDKSNIALGPFKDKFIVSSLKRYPHTKVDINKYTKEKIPNLMCTEVSYDYDLKYPTLFSQPLKSEYNQGSITFNKENTVAFLTRKKNLQDETYYLFRTELVDTIKGIWTAPIEVLIDGQSIPMSYPKLSKNNKHIYFAANLPQGYGGYDIYKAESIDGKSFINIQNLGPEVNTEYNENSAVNEGDFIYFSSDMPGGFGGYDIYRISSKKGIYKYKINIGNKINTSNDEINLIPITKSEGYFTSDKNNKEIFDVFRYKIQLNNINVYTTFVDRDKNIIANLPVEIIDEDGNIIFEGLTNNKGVVIINTEPFNEINYNFTSTDYYTDKRLFYAITDDTSDHYKIIELDSYIKTVPQLLVEKPSFTEVTKNNIIYFGFDKYNVQSNYNESITTIATLLKNNPELVVTVEGYADSKGPKNYNMKLSEKRADAVIDLLLQQGISSNQIIKEPNGSSNFAINCKVCTKNQDALNRRVIFNFELE